jgi:hypothetical protein
MIAVPGNFAHPTGRGFSCSSCKQQEKNRRPACVEIRSAVPSLPGHEEAPARFPARGTVREFQFRE